MKDVYSDTTSHPGTSDTDSLVIKDSTSAHQDSLATNGATISKSRSGYWEGTTSDSTNISFVVNFESKKVLDFILTYRTGCDTTFTYVEEFDIDSLFFNSDDNFVIANGNIFKNPYKTIKNEFIDATKAEGSYWFKGANVTSSECTCEAWSGSICIRWITTSSRTCNSGGNGGWSAEYKMSLSEFTNIILSPDSLHINDSETKFVNGKSQTVPKLEYAFGIFNEGYESLDWSAKVASSDGHIKLLNESGTLNPKSSDSISIVLDATKCDMNIRLIKCSTI